MTHYHWGVETAGEMKYSGLVVDTYNEDYEIANVVFVLGKEILLPVPRRMYTPNPADVPFMTKSFYYKYTTLMPMGEAVQIQLDSRQVVTWMVKENKAHLPLRKEKCDWVADVDVAISPETPEYPDRRACIQNEMIDITMALVDHRINLDSFETDKPYKGKIKLVVYHDSLEKLAKRGITAFIQGQEQYIQAGSACYSFLLYELHETDDPNIAVVYDAPWQTVKRTIILKNVQYEDEDEAPVHVEKYEAPPQARDEVFVPEQPQAGNENIPPPPPKKEQQVAETPSATGMSAAEMRKAHEKLDPKRFEPFLSAAALEEIMQKKYAIAEKEEKAAMEMKKSKAAKALAAITTKKGLINPDSSSMKAELRQYGNRKREERKKKTPEEQSKVNGMNWIEEAKMHLAESVKRVEEENAKRKQKEEEEKEEENGQDST